MNKKIQVALYCHNKSFKQHNKDVIYMKGKSNFLTRFANLSYMKLIEHELVSLFPQIELNWQGGEF